MKTIFKLLIALGLTCTLTANETRELTSADGRKVTAQVMRVENGKVRIRVGQQVHDLALSQFSAEDQAWLKQWTPRSGAGPASGATTSAQGYYDELIFQDDFSGNQLGERWGHYVSDSIVQDGVLVGRSKDIAVHAGVDNIKFEGRRDLEVSVKFKFAGPDAKRFNIWFDDYNYKASHAGHISSIDFTLNSLSMSDAKTGAFEKNIYAQRKTPEGLDEATTEMLKTKRASTKLDLKEGQWYSLVVRTKGPTVTVLIDDKQVGEFSSEGIAHETKSLVSLTTNVKDVHYDDFVIRAAKNPTP